MANIERIIKAAWSKVSGRSKKVLNLQREIDRAAFATTESLVKGKCYSALNIAMHRLVKATELVCVAGEEQREQVADAIDEVRRVAENCCVYEKKG